MKQLQRALKSPRKENAFLLRNSVCARCACVRTTYIIINASPSFDFLPTPLLVAMVTALPLIRGLVNIPLPSLSLSLLLKEVGAEVETAGNTCKQAPCALLCLKSPPLLPSPARHPQLAPPAQGLVSRSPRSPCWRCCGCWQGSA